MKKENKEIVFVTPRAKIVLWLVCLIVGGALLSKYIPIIHSYMIQLFLSECEPGIAYHVIPDPLSPIIIITFIIALTLGLLRMMGGKKDE